VDPQELVTVYTAGNSVEAEIVKNALLDEGIKAFIDGEMQAAESGLPAIPVKVIVPAFESERARKFVEIHEQRRKRRGNVKES
jgi:Putative prokaryotic signal transducing protein